MLGPNHTPYAVFARENLRSGGRDLLGINADEWPGVRNNPDGSQDVLLDKPIVRVPDDQVFDEKSTSQIAEVLAGWVSIDRVNIVNRHADLNFVVSPRAYETGKPPSGPDAAAGYWHPQNLPKCMVNLGRSAAAVWNLLEPHQQQAGFPDPWKAGMPRLKELLLWLCEGDPNLRGVYTKSEWLSRTHSLSGHE